jgi:protein arginine N-methyltransferase 7
MGGGLRRIPAETLQAMAREVQGDARKTAALSGLALSNGQDEMAYSLARDARRLAPGDPDVVRMTERAFTGSVPRWHFRIVEDEARNHAWEAAIARNVGPGTRVLEIGAGTGLLALMAARAGAGSVISCEMNPAVADAAANIVAANGYADRVRIVPKCSADLELEADLGGRIDLLVSEIVSNDMLGEAVLATMEDVQRLLAPGARIIPSHGQIRVALAYWPVPELGNVAGFDLSAFNRLRRLPHLLKAGDPNLVLRSAPADLFDFDFTSGGPYPAGRAELAMTVDGAGPVNGFVQWIRLQLDETGVYENLPAPGASSCWAVRFHPFSQSVDTAPGTVIRLRGYHDRERISFVLEGTD